jgi:hypothetical protein
VEVKPFVNEKNIFTDSASGVQIQIDPKLKFIEYFPYNEFQTYTEGGTATKSGDTWTADIYMFGTGVKGGLIIRKKAGDGNFWLGLKPNQVKNLIKQTSSDGFENLITYNLFPFSRKMFDAIFNRVAYKTSDNALIYTRNMVSWKDKKIEYNLIYAETIDGSICPIDPKLMTQVQTEAVKEFEQRAINAVKILQI